eukprot:7935717-Pyramimonas_sp.AAC.1
MQIFDERCLWTALSHSEPRNPSLQPCRQAGVSEIAGDWVSMLPCKGLAGARPLLVRSPSRGGAPLSAFLGSQRMACWQSVRESIDELAEMRAMMNDYFADCSSAGAPCHQRSKQRGALT